MDYPKIKRISILDGDKFAEIRNADLMDERLSRQEFEAALRDDIREVFSRAPKDVKDLLSESFVRWINALTAESAAEVDWNGKKA